MKHWKKTSMLGLKNPKRVEIAKAFLKNVGEKIKVTKPKVKLIIINFLKLSKKKIMGFWKKVSMLGSRDPIRIAAIKAFPGDNKGNAENVKPKVKATNGLVIKKGDRVYTQKGIGTIVKYSSNKEIYLDNGKMVSKEEVIRVVN